MQYMTAPRHCAMVDGINVESHFLLFQDADEAVRIAKGNLKSS